MRIECRKMRRQEAGVSKAEELIPVMASTVKASASSPAMV